MIILLWSFSTLLSSGLLLADYRYYTRDLSDLGAKGLQVASATINTRETIGKNWEFHLAP